jgi:hypothetical protein
MMLDATRAGGIFDILVSHGDLSAENKMHFEFKRDDFLYHASRDITEYHYKNSKGTVITVEACPENTLPLVLTVDESATEEEKTAIAYANEEIVSYVAAVLAHDAQYLAEHDVPEFLVDMEAVSL